MNNQFIFIAISIFIIFAVIFILSKLQVKRGGGVAEKYLYERKKFFLTRDENEFYKALVLAVGDKYFIFAQVHLSALFNHKVVGQNWRGALSHIHRKSVDFVLCDKQYISPQIAIELDDKSHERPDRQERDKCVNDIFQSVGLPLLRIENCGKFSSSDIAFKINEALKLSGK